MTDNLPTLLTLFNKAFVIVRKPLPKNVKVIGKHNDLLKITDVPLAYAKQAVIDYNINYNNEYKNNKFTLDVSVDFDKKLFTSSSNDIVAKSNNLNIGYLFLQDIYNDLKIKDFLDNIASKFKLSYNCDTINRFFTFSRILDPKSNLAFMIIFTLIINSLLDCQHFLGQF
ncbi:MAG: hypothetical protein ACK5KR_06820 [Breznakia sp.]